MDFGSILQTFLVGLVAGFINILAAGGSAISVPFLIFLGLEPGIANGTNRVPILCQCFSACLAYRKKVSINYKKAFLYGLLMIPGSLAGVWMVAQVPSKTLQHILAVVVGIVALLTLLPSKKAKTTTKPSKKKELLFYFSLILLSLYGGFLQIGLGFIFIAIFRYFTNASFVEISSYKAFVILIYFIPLIFAFESKSLIHWPSALYMSAGNISGAWIASKLAIAKGDRIIKFALAFALVLIMLKTFLG